MVIYLPKPTPFVIEELTVPIWRVENFGLSEQLSTVFNAGSIVGIGPSTLSAIIENLQSTYCDSIGVEYMYVRNVEKKIGLRIDYTKIKIIQILVRSKKKTYLTN